MIESFLLQKGDKRFVHKGRDWWYAMKTKIFTFSRNKKAINKLERWLGHVMWQMLSTCKIIWRGTSWVGTTALCKIFSLVSSFNWQLIWTSNPKPKIIMIIIQLTRPTTYWSPKKKKKKKELIAIVLICTWFCLSIHREATITETDDTLVTMSCVDHQRH